MVKSSTSSLGASVSPGGEPDSPQARTWVSLEPGWRVFDDGPGHLNGITIEYQGHEGSTVQ
jgi:hypothetical protein